MTEKNTLKDYLGDWTLYRQMLKIAIPISLQEYVFLSSERKGDAITVYYRDVPADDSEPSQYATTLKKSTENGYFSFVSTRRVGAVG